RTAARGCPGRGGGSGRGRGPDGAHGTGNARPGEAAAGDEVWERLIADCDFSIAVRKRIPAREYVEAVLRELEQVRSADPGAVPRGALKTLYLGGGTPSLLPP